MSEFIDTIRVGDVGTSIILDCGLDVSTATVRKIYVRSPTGAKKTWNASAEGTNSIKYALIEGDIDISGEWELQSYIEMPGWKGRGTWAILNVEN